MSVKKFKFVSPGIFLSEVDNSQLPAIKQAVGPVVIGRTRMGPTMRPVSVSSPSEFVQVFGNPIPGEGPSGDVWRDGNLTAPTYAAYAAMAYLKADVGPITMVRLLGEDNPENDGAGIALSGWRTDATRSPSTAGGAYGIFVFPSSSAAINATGTLGAVIYVNSGSIALGGEVLKTISGGEASFVGNSAAIESEGANSQFKLNIFNTQDQSTTTAASVEGTTAGPTWNVGGSGNDINITVDALAPATATFTDKTAGSATSLLAAPSNTQTLLITVDGGSEQTIILAGLAGPTTLEVANSINTQLIGASADGAGGLNVIITSDTTGIGSTIAVNATSTAVTLGGMSFTPTAGAGNVVDNGAVTFAEAKAVIEAAIAGLTVTQNADPDLVLTTLSKDGTSSIINITGGTATAALGFTAPASTTGATTPGGTPTLSTAFNFDRDSDLNIRSVLNTNPQLTNDAFVNPTTLKNGENLYWLGESFETDVEEALGGLDRSSRAVLLPLASGSLDRDDYKGIDFQTAKTGYFFSQDLSNDFAAFDPSAMTKLFRFVSLDGGRWIQNNLKIAVQDIKASTNKSDPYGSFSIVVRAASDRDNVIQIVERWTNVNLNPASENFIGRVIGDTYYSFDYTQRVLRQYGQYANKSKYIRVDMNPDVSGLNPKMLPFGVTGPLRFKTINYTKSGAIPANAFVLASGSTPGATAPAGEICPADGIWLGDGTCTVTGLQLDFPKQLLRLSASDGGLADPTDACFGPMSTISRNSSRKDSSWGDYLWRRPDGVTSEDTLAGISDDLVEYSWTVTLDDVVTSGSATSFWKQDARKNGNSATAQGSWQSILSAGYDKIVAPLYGGFDGLDITEAEPFRNGILSTGGDLDTANYAYNSIKRAVDTIKDPEFVECNIVTIPGVTNSTLTQHVIDTCEDRGDALAIIDLPDVYTPFTDSTNTFEQRNQFTISECVDGLRDRGINSSYACTYYPWVQLLDTISNNLLWAPPSVVALGTLASSQAKSEVWFAPAGFNRGGLTDGSAGWPVTNITKRLTSKDRDKLYEANINPIASFPSEGLVVFGQKTLQVTRSALDRINVRRLLIYIKKQVSRISSGILFDQNVQVTWNRFLGEVRPFLASVQSRLGLSEWRVILDDTTTTPDLVDQNIMYAKIFLKPARAIEFIAVDFVITRTGASFDD